MTHPLVMQLRFARSELVRCLEGVFAEDARRRLEPMNCVSIGEAHAIRQMLGYPDLPQLVGVGDMSNAVYRPEH